MTWECFCQRLLDEQEDVSPGRLPNFDAPAALRVQLGLPSFRALYQVGCAVGLRISTFETSTVKRQKRVMLCTATWDVLLDACVR